MLKGQAVKRLSKKAKKGFRGYPMATIAFYGPDNKRASKAAVAVISTAEAEPDEPRRWFSDDSDVRTDPQIIAEILAFVAENGVLSVVMTGGIIGCPHEEGIDYEGQICPRCPFWANRDRWTGEIIH
jgi:hypothetical protein